MGWGKNIYQLAWIAVRKVCNGYYLRWYYNGWHYWYFYPGQHGIETEGEKYFTIGTRKVRMGSGQLNEDQAQAVRTIMNTREVYLLTSVGWADIRIEPGSISIYHEKVAGAEIEFTAILGSREVSIDDGFTPVEDIPVVESDLIRKICMVYIGDQVWMCNNWDAPFPGSKVYLNNESYRDPYGGLYTFDQVNADGFCPDGWHVPTVDEWQQLITFLGGEAGAAGELKEIGATHWVNPNTGAVDTYNFTAVGSGTFNDYIQAFTALKLAGSLWTADPYDATRGYIVTMIYSSAAISIAYTEKANFFGVRLIKDVKEDFDDWFLPSAWELYWMYTNLKANGIGNFVDDTYWSSTENIATQAIVIDFTDGTFFLNDAKGNVNPIRAIRSFTDDYDAYEIGDNGPAGGFIFFIDGLTYYEARRIDETPAAWSNVINVLIGTTLYDVGEGYNNTQEIIAQPGHTNSAAQDCNDLST